MKDEAAWFWIFAIFGFAGGVYCVPQRPWFIVAGFVGAFLAVSLWAAFGGVDE